jgi:aminopeptidase-like protein
MFYNGPGFLIPTVGIGGLHHPECDFDADNLDVVNPYQLRRSMELLLKIIETLESDFIPVPKFRGPLYLSRYGLYVDRTLNPKEYDNIEAMQILMNGENSCLDISYKLGIDFFFIRDFCEQVYAKGLLEKEYKNFLN